MTPLVSGLASVASFIFNATSNRSSSAAASTASAQSSSSSSTNAGPASVLKLSAEAQPLAGAAGNAAQKAAAASTTLASTAGTANSSGKAVSKEDFQSLLTQFGATEAQKEQITAGLDANKDGSISQDEFLKGLANTQGTESGSALSQSLMQVMDQAGNRDGTVGGKEFLTLTAAFATASQGVRKA
ncbi:EF-hand domain-containing protein [Acidovorax sp. DW039]|uniref:EF-hand domain-containing protein n=1 Tax=Acidovorax sp. DW039 TaxID=3095606 RepID=UPI0030869138|nr:EF-hand domain-containing protein [Acidovorax sp. DW039]